MDADVFAMILAIGVGIGVVAWFVSVFTVF